MKDRNIYFLDWKNDLSYQRYQELSVRYKNVYRINLQDNIVDSLRLLAQLSDTEYFWVISSLTDYTNFDFDAYNEIGLEPYTQVFGANTWFTSKTVAGKISNEQYVEALPDLHFVNSDLRIDNDLLDIVYISNGEPYAEKHYLHLLNTAKTGNKIHRIDGVNGRTAAYQAAARLSNTAWFFAVFAKLEVNPNFDWTWRPDPINGPLHYIFHAQNPVNGLEYGHMAMVAYNKSLTLSTYYTGLDFVMTRPHTIVPIDSGVAHYNQDPIVTWRTAFRECIKLKQNASEENQVRLNAWLNVSQGQHGIWSTRGARDAVDYYNNVNGEFEKLLLSYDWAWLNTQFRQKYNR